MASLVIADPPQDEEAQVEETPDREFSLKASVLKKAETSHGKLPGIRRIPLPAIGIILLIAVVNLAVWIGVGIVLVRLFFAVVMRIDRVYLNATAGDDC